MKIGSLLKTGMLFVTILIFLHSEYLTKEVLVWLGDLKIGGKVIRSVKCTYYFVLLSKEETLLQSLMVRLIEIGRYCGMKLNVEIN